MNILQFIFHYHQRRLADMLEIASKQEDIGFWFAVDGIRQPIIMLEGWTRICQHIYQDEIFKKWNEIYKELQEKIGELQHYWEAERQMFQMNSIPDAVKKELNELVVLRKATLEIVLIAGGWLYDNQVGLMNKQLSHFDWGNDEETIDKMEIFYINQVELLGEQEEFNFSDVKGDLRELRHKLRWLCIYPHATLGLFSYSPFSETRNLTRMKKYMADKVEQSPYAILPTLLKEEHQILVDKYALLSVNWIVEKLGKFYRTGLKEIILREAIKESGMFSPDTDKQNSYKLLGHSQPRMDILLSVSSTVTSLYFQEKNIESLLV